MAKRILGRALIEHLYTYAQRLPLGMTRTMSKAQAPLARRRVPGITFGFPRAVLLEKKDVDLLVCSGHRACGVRPVVQEQAEALLPCPRWRVRAARRLLAEKRSIREGLLDLRTNGESSAGAEPLGGDHEVGGGPP